MISENVFKDFAIEGQSAKWKVPGDLPHFNGHFPGNPIFPAVGIMDATVFVLGKILGKKVFVPHISAAKFLSPIQPDQHVRIEMTSAKENSWQADWKDESSQKLLATLRFNL